MRVATYLLGKGVDILMPQNQLQTTTGLSSSLVRSLQSTKDDLLTPQWARERRLHANCPLANISAESCS